MKPGRSGDARRGGRGAPGLTLKGPAGWEQLWQDWQAASPDNLITPLNWVAAGQTVAVEATFAGTQTGTLQSPGGAIPPTGKWVKVKYANLLRIEGEQIASMHVYFDQVELLMQLGLMPAPAGV